MVRTLAAVACALGCAPSRVAGDIVDVAAVGSLGGDPRARWGPLEAAGVLAPLRKEAPSPRLLPLQRRVGARARRKSFIVAIPRTGWPDTSKLFETPRPAAFPPAREAAGPIPVTAVLLDGEIVAAGVGSGLPLDAPGLRRFSMVRPADAPTSASVLEDAQANLGVIAPPAEVLPPPLGASELTVPMPPLSQLLPLLLLATGLLALCLTSRRRLEPE